MPDGEWGLSRAKGFCRIRNCVAEATGRACIINLHPAPYFTGPDASRQARPEAEFVCLNQNITILENPCPAVKDPAASLMSEKV